MRSILIFVLCLPTVAFASDPLESPRLTRDGTPRIVDGSAFTPEAAPALIERLSLPGSDDGLRRAWADALVRNLRTEDDARGLGQAWAALAVEDADPFVRDILLRGLRHAPAAHAIPALSTSLSDPDPTVRAAAANGLAWHSDGARAGAALVAALDDPDGDVRQAVIVATGWLGLSEAVEGVAAAVADGDAGVRLVALRSLQRLAPERAARMAPGLMGDADARVRHLAHKLGG